MTLLETYWEQGLGVREIATLLNVSKSTVAARRKELISVALDCIDLSERLSPEDGAVLRSTAVASLRRLLRVPA